MALNNQIISSVAANLEANAAGGITGANFANVTSNLQTFISNNGTDVKSVSIQSSTDASFTANYTLTLPVNDGSSGQVLATDGSGVLSWANVSTSNIVNGNSNVNVEANANVTISSAGNANIVVVTGTGANVTGTLNVSANANTGNLGTAELIATGNVAFTSSPNVALGAVGNVHITGGSANQYLQTDGAGNLSFQTLSTSSISNGNSNVDIPSANGNVNISAVGNANVLVVTGTGANITGSLDVTANANTGNLGTNTAIITTGNITTVNTGLVQNGNSNIAITSNANVTITANSNAVIAITSSGDGNLQTTGANITGYLNATGNATASNLVVKANGSLTFTTGSSNVSSATLTTTTASANQALAVISAADGRAVEFIVKGIDSAGAKYTATTILALVGNAANADCDFTLFAQLNTGTSPGDLSVALTDSNANITLQVSPASTNSTVWTTQYRVI